MPPATRSAPRSVSLATLPQLTAFQLKLKIWTNHYSFFILYRG
nr:MAG TPA: hypothetical protein [Bacteriophage sp.]